MSGHVERLEAYLDARAARGHDGTIASMPGYVSGGGPGMYERRVLTDADLRAALDELERLRAERPGRGFLAQAYTNGWHDAIAAYRAPGWAEREAGWKKYIAEAESAPQQPEGDGEPPC